MKKLLLLTIMALFFNGCRYINTTEKYVDAKEPKKLTIPSGVDAPNSSSTLEVPEANSTKGITEKSNPAPPEMPLRTKQSENGELRISNESGFSVLTVKTDKDVMWQALKTLTIENWSVTNADEDQCTVLLKYTDQAAIEQENAGFFKKIFSRKGYHSDFSGDYKLTCNQKGAINQVKFSTADGSPTKSFLADNVMTKLYGVFE